MFYIAIHISNMLNNVVRNCPHHSSRPEVLTLGEAVKPCGRIILKKQPTHKVVKPEFVALPPPTIIEFLLDETGSMNRFLSQTLGGFQDFIDEQRKLNGLCLLTLTKFDTTGLRNPYIDLDIGMVPYLTTNTYTPNSVINLYDTIVNRIDARYNQLNSWDIKPRVLFCVYDRW